MDWSQTIVILVSLGSIFFWFVSRFDKDIYRLEKDINNLSGEVKNFANKIEADMRLQSARTDQLYQMFIDLLKEGKK